MYLKMWTEHYTGNLYKKRLPWTLKKDSASIIIRIFRGRGIVCMK